MKAYIIHVSTAYSRNLYITKQLESKNIDFTFINDGDMSDLTPSIIEEYFDGDLAGVTPRTSCAYKHLLAYQKILEGEEEVAMVVEDDIYLYNNYNVMIKKIVDEVRRKNISNFILSLEDSTLRYIPGSQRKKGEYVYPAKHDRYTGMYLIDKKGIKSLLNQLKVEKMDIPIDCFHNHCLNNGIINMYWSQPPISIQGSLNGSIRSLIDNKRVGTIRRISFMLQRIYKICLYYFR